MKGSQFVQQANHMTRARRVLATILAGTALMAGIGVPAITSGAPYTVREKYAGGNRQQAKLDAFGHQVGVAAEKYNGARWKLGNIRADITKNEGVLKKATADLHISQRILSERMDALYRHPDPSLVEVLVSSGSLTDAVGQVDAIQRAGAEDAHVVGNMRTFRDRTVRIGVQLTKDRESAKVEVAKAAAAKSRIEAILAQRKSVLQSARADLRAAIAQEAARQRGAALAAASSGYKPFDGPLPDGAGNAEAARIALQYQGVPYVWGGASPSGFDCSGLASYAYAQIGKSVPHYTYAIWSAFPQVPPGQYQPGDLVMLNGLGHMGIYIGDGMMVHAPRTGDVVRVVPVSSRSDIVGVVRP